MVRSKTQQPPHALEQSQMRTPVDTLWVVLMLSVVAIIFWIKFAPYQDIGTYNDDVQYIEGARSIAASGRYLNTVEPGNLPQVRFPPGYPMLLAPVVSMFPTSDRAIQVVSLLLLLVTLCGMSFVFRDLTTGEFALVGVLVVTNPLVIHMTTVAMSEMAYAALSMFVFASLRSRGWVRPVLVGLLLVYAFLVRSLGVSLMAGVCLWLLISDRSLRDGLIVGGIGVCGVGLYMLRNAAAVKRFPDLESKTYVSDFLQFVKGYDNVFSFVKDYIVILWNQIANFSTNMFGVFSYFGPLGIGRMVAGLCCVGFTVWAIRKTWTNRQSAPVVWYLISTWALILVWNQVELRYFIPLIPFYYYLFIRSTRVQRLSPAGKFYRYGFLTLAVCSSIVSIWTLGIPNKEAPFFRLQAKLPHETFRWIAEQTPPQAVVGTEFAALKLKTGRMVVDVPWRERPDFIVKSMAKAGAEYLLIRPSYVPIKFREPDVKFKKNTVVLIMNSPLFLKRYENQREQTVVLMSNPEYRSDKFPQAWQLSQRGIRAYMKRQVDVAAAFFEQAVALDKKLFTARLILAKHTCQRGDTQTALRLIDEAITIWPKYAEGYRAKAECYAFIKDTAQAEMYLRLASKQPVQ